MEEEFFDPVYKSNKQYTQEKKRAASRGGFGALFNDQDEMGLNLNEQLVMNKASTFFLRMNGDAMLQSGIFDRDVLIVDRSIKPTNGKIIIAAVDGELITRYYKKAGINKVLLVPANTSYKTIELGEFTAYECWGVVTCVVHILDASLQAHLNNNEKKGRTHASDAQ